MSEVAAEVSVVIPSRDRADLLARQLAALRAQTLDPARFEIVVVDDGSADATESVLAAAQKHGGAPLRVVRHDTARGPAAARNAGWRCAAAPLIAFTDDDCVADPGWLAAGVAAWGRRDDVFVQGATSPIEAERERLLPFGYSIDVQSMSAEFETCNIFYPRALLETLGGLDEAFPGAQGEDVDLAWRARDAGATPVFEPAARVQHAVVDLGPAGHLRRAWRWSPAMLAFARHPALRRERLFHGIFWNWSHYLLARALLALPFARHRAGWPVAWWLARRFIVYALERGRLSGSPALAGYWIAHDAVETAGVVRGAVRYRTLVV